MISRVAARVRVSVTTHRGAYHDEQVTPTATYQHLSSIMRRGLVSLNKCHFVLFDEFFSSDDVRPDASESARVARLSLSRTHSHRSPSLRTIGS